MFRVRSVQSTLCRKCSWFRNPYCTIIKSNCQTNRHFDIRLGWSQSDASLLVITVITVHDYQARPKLKQDRNQDSTSSKTSQDYIQQDQKSRFYIKQNRNQDSTSSKTEIRILHRARPVRTTSSKTSQDYIKQDHKSRFFIKQNQNTARDHTSVNKTKAQDHRLIKTTWLHLILDARSEQSRFQKLLQPPILPSILELEQPCVMCICRSWN